MKIREECKDAVLPIHLPMLNVWGILKSLFKIETHIYCFETFYRIKDNISTQTNSVLFMNVINLVLLYD
jgi:hypothetical protein